MVNENFTKIEYDLLYTKIETSYYGGKGSMDFYGFIEAIEIIASRLFPEEFQED